MVQGLEVRRGPDPQYSCRFRLVLLFRICMCIHIKLEDVCTRPTSISANKHFEMLDLFGRLLFRMYSRLVQVYQANNQLGVSIFTLCACWFADLPWVWLVFLAHKLRPGDRVVDMATGTADVAIMISEDLAKLEKREMAPGTVYPEVVGIDPSTRMLEVGPVRPT